MRLDQITEQYGAAVAVRYHAFLLRPAPEPRTVEAFTRYTNSWMRPAEMEPAASFQVWSGKHEPPSHSVPGLVAGKAAETFGEELSGAFHRRMLQAYFTENRTISDRDVQLDVAADVGIDAEAFAPLLDEQRFVEAVVADHEDAYAHGITAVPSVVVNGQYLLQGALDVAQYERVVEKLGSEAG